MGTPHAKSGSAVRVDVDPHGSRRRALRSDEDPFPGGLRDRNRYAREFHGPGREEAVPTLHRWLQKRRTQLPRLERRPPEHREVFAGHRTAAGRGDLAQLGSMIFGEPAEAHLPRRGFFFGRSTAVIVFVV